MRPLEYKKSLKRNPSSNYRLITCLPMMWKILTAQIREEIFYSQLYFPRNRKAVTGEQVEKVIYGTLISTDSRKVKRSGKMKRGLTTKSPMISSRKARK